MAADIVSLVQDQLLTKRNKTEEKLNEMEISLKRNGLNYLRQNCVLHLLRSHATYDREFRNTLTLKECFHLKPTLNIDEDCWKTQLPSSSDWNRTKQVAINFIKEHVKVKCEDISSWLQECTNVTSEIETGQLLRSLKDKVKTKSQKEKNVQKLKDQIQSQNVTNYKLLCDSCQILSDLIINYQSTYIATQTGNYREYLTSKTIALDLKLKVIKLQLMVSTYSEDKVSALREIKSYLDANRQQIELQLMQVQQSLEQYNSLGDEFIKLAQEYHQIKQEIDNKKWALNELGKFNV